MVAQFDTLREANRVILARIAEREEHLTARAHALEGELGAIENERRNLRSDRETIQKAEAIQLKVFGSFQPAAVEVETTSRPDGGQTRARIGAKRYAMLVALRDRGSLTVEEIASHTGLGLTRVREQMRADQPNYVNLDVGPTYGQTDQKLLLTIGGANLLGRFESYRRASGKALPPLKYAVDASDDDDASVEADEADTEAQKEEAAGTAPTKDAPTASVEDNPSRDFLGSSNPDRGPQAAERQVEHDNMR